MMNEQIIILFCLIIVTGITLFICIWKAKKEINYRGDERWQLIQNKSNKVANYLIDIFVVFLLVGSVASLFFHTKITFTLDSLLTYGTLFIGLRNAMELFALIYFDKRM